jgi:hypothetical protein
LYSVTLSGIEYEPAVADDVVLKVASGKVAVPLPLVSLQPSPVSENETPLGNVPFVASSTPVLSPPPEYVTSSVVELPLMTGFVVCVPESDVVADATPSPTRGVATDANINAGRKIRRKRFITVRQSQLGSQRTQLMSLLERPVVVTVYAVFRKLGPWNSTPELQQLSALRQSGSRMSFGVPIRLSTAPKPFGFGDPARPHLSGDRADSHPTLE